MRRFAVPIAIGLALASACTPGKLLLPSDKADGGGDSGGNGSGGSIGSGGGGSGGAPSGSGGRTQGSGGFFGGGGALGGGGRPGSGGSGMPVTCGGAQNKLNRDIQRAKVVFALGRNATMGATFGTTGGTRMTVAQEAIRTVVSQRQKAISFGYEDFPAPAGSCPNSGGCCINLSPLSPVFPSLSNYPLIDSALMSCDTSSGTSGCVFQSMSRPIADAIRNVYMPPQRPPLLDLFRGGDQRLILMVDGGPACSSEDSAASCSSALNQLSQVTDRLRIHVIPLGLDAESSDCLRAIALQSNSGGTNGQPFAFHAGDPRQLLDSLSAIVADAAKSACTIELREEVSDVNRVSVEIAGRVVPKDLSGWTFVSGSKRLIDVHGSWCEEIQSRNDSEVIVYYCQ